MVADVECEEEPGSSNAGPAANSGNQYNMLNYKKKNLPSLADSWRWLKGLLYDFVSLKKENTKNLQNLGKANHLFQKMKHDKKSNNGKTER